MLNDGSNSSSLQGLTVGVVTGDLDLAIYCYQHNTVTCLVTTPVRDLVPAEIGRFIVKPDCIALDKLDSQIHFFLLHLA